MRALASGPWLVLPQVQRWYQPRKRSSMKTLFHFREVELLTCFLTVSLRRSISSILMVDSCNAWSWDTKKHHWACCFLRENKLTLARIARTRLWTSSLSCATLCCASRSIAVAALTSATRRAHGASPVTDHGSWAVLTMTTAISNLLFTTCSASIATGRKALALPVKLVIRSLTDVHDEESLAPIAVDEISLTAARIEDSWKVSFFVRISVI